MSQLQSESRSVRRSTARVAASASAERRTRRRLRDLCDEVLASYRVARGIETVSDDDRAAAAAMLSQIGAPFAR